MNIVMQISSWMLRTALSMLQFLAGYATIGQDRKISYPVSNQDLSAERLSNCAVVIRESNSNSDSEISFNRIVLSLLLFEEPCETASVAIGLIVFIAVAWSLLCL